eukprot:Sro1074_g238270.1 n/a (285) ;mRNA; r:9834-10688
MSDGSPQPLPPVEANYDHCFNNIKLMLRLCLPHPVNDVEHMHHFCDKFGVNKAEYLARYRRYMGGIHLLSYGLDLDSDDEDFPDEVVVPRFLPLPAVASPPRTLTRVLFVEKGDDLVQDVAVQDVAAEGSDDKPDKSEATLEVKSDEKTDEETDDEKTDGGFDKLLARPCSWVLSQVPDAKDDEEYTSPPKKAKIANADGVILSPLAMKSPGEDRSPSTNDGEESESEGEENESNEGDDDATSKEGLGQLTHNSSDEEEDSDDVGGSGTGGGQLEYAESGSIVY